jgi:hypothetical protein
MIKKHTKNLYLCNEMQCKLSKSRRLKGVFVSTLSKDETNNPQRLNQLYNMSKLVQRILYKVCTKCTVQVLLKVIYPPLIMYTLKNLKRNSDDLGENTKQGTKYMLPCTGCVDPD